MRSQKPRFGGVSFLGTLSAFLTAAKQTESDMRSPRALLAKAERKLRAGKVSEAINLFEEIVDGYVPSLEQLAALAYLRSSKRKPPRRARS
jgi:hypothetical protein